MTTLLLVFIFSVIWSPRKDPSIVNYYIYLLIGRLFYEIYSQATKRAMRSVSGAASIIKKVKVPKYIYPIANVISNFVTFLISLLVLVAFLIFFSFVNVEGQNPPNITWRALLFPVPILVMFLLCIGVGLILATLSVFFKDIEYMYDVFCMLIFYATPIFYAPGSMAGKTFLQYMFRLNPLYSIVEMMRDLVLRGVMLNPHHLLYATGFSFLMILLGGLLFWKKQDKFILHI
jgi:ABC-type polysaccharide/polyol phosphate export permease